MIELWNAQPDFDRSFYLRSQINSRVIDSLFYMFGKCADASIPTAMAFESISACDPMRKIGGMLHVLHNRLFDSIKKENRVNILYVLSVISHYKFYFDDIRIISWYDDSYSMDLHELYFDASDDGFFSTYGMHFDGTTLTDSEFEISKSAVLQALNTIKISLPSFYIELNVLISDLMLMQSPTMNAASSMSSLGIVRMSQLRSHQNWTRYFENIIHEAGHQYLNCLWAVDPIILNDMESSFYSPLRKEGRPLSGIYHALFVLSRTINAFKVLKKSYLYDETRDVISTGYNNSGNQATHEEKFDSCWKTLKENARLTELGRKLMYNCREFAFD